MNIKRIILNDYMTNLEHNLSNEDEYIRNAQAQEDALKSELQKLHEKQMAEKKAQEEARLKAIEDE